MPPNITAECTAAFIQYTGDWSKNNYLDPSQRIATAPNSSAGLYFRGSAVSVYGNYPPGPSSEGSYSVNVTLDNADPFSIYNGGPSQGEARDQLLYNTTFVDANSVHRMQLTLVSGSLNLSRIIWTDPKASSSDTYTPRTIIAANSSSPQSVIFQPPTGSWVPTGDSMCTSDNGSSIQFNFQGTGIVVQGVGNTSFSVLIDNETGSTTLFARAPASSLTQLFRNDTLLPGNHSVTLTNNGGLLCVDQAQVFDANTSGSSGPLSRGPIIVIVIVALLIPSALVLGAVYMYRRRRDPSGTTPRRMVDYDRLCSKCGKSIGGPYRLQCVDPNCPAEVDLHMQCADWNTPERHSHAVRRVLNL